MNFLAKIFNKKKNTNNNKKLKNLSDEDFIKDYLKFVSNNNLTLKEFAKKLGISYEAIRKRRKKFNLPYKRSKSNFNII